MSLLKKTIEKKANTQDIQPLLENLNVQSLSIEQKITEIIEEIEHIQKINKKFNRNINEL